MIWLHLNHFTNYQFVVNSVTLQIWLNSGYIEREADFRHRLIKLFVVVKWIFDSLLFWFQLQVSWAFQLKIAGVFTFKDFINVKLLHFVQPFPKLCEFHRNWLLICFPVICFSAWATEVYMNCELCISYLLPVNKFWCANKNWFEFVISYFSILYLNDWNLKSTKLTFFWIIR